MRNSIIGFALAAGLVLVPAASLEAGTSRADAVPAFMAVAFDNTVMSHYPDGGWVKHWFNRDGSYEGRFSDGRRITARWEVDRNRVCLDRIIASRTLDGLGAEHVNAIRVTVATLIPRLIHGDVWIRYHSIGGSGRAVPIGAG